MHGCNFCFVSHTMCDMYGVFLLRSLVFFFFFALVGLDEM
jgi:hypothetical protein